MRLKDKVVLVTASTRGIGLACVQACAAEGAVVYMGARNMERAEDRAKELNEKGFRVKTVYNDATKHDRDEKPKIEETGREQRLTAAASCYFFRILQKKQIKIKAAVLTN